MAEIKSALELALARTQDVKSDKEGLKARDISERGRRMMSAFLNDHRDPERLEQELSRVSSDEKTPLTRGAFAVLKANLVLPVGPFQPEQLALLRDGFIVLTGQKKKIQGLFDQLDQFFQQYDKSRTQLKEAIKAQIMPTLKAKAREMSAKTGVEVAMDPEKYPEFGQILSDNMVRVNEQFQVPLDELKASLEDLLPRG
jgi:hypothetical protein